MSRARSIAGVHRPDAATDDWITPRALIDALGPFDLDPCASATQPWPTAARMIAPPSNGLREQWHTIGRTSLVWLNPPYGQATAAWLRRAEAEAREPTDPVATIALVFARTETRWFQEIAPRASALLFLAGRLTFCRPDGTPAPHNSGGPSVLLAFGDAAARRLEARRGRHELAGLLVSGAANTALVAFAPNLSR